MIEKRYDLCQLMFDVQLAYAFQDVEKNHNPKNENNINRELFTKRKTV
jgi:hypothetical protein